KDVPITAGHDAKGLVLPEFDLQGRMRGELRAGVTRRLDEQNFEFLGVKFTTFVPETETPDLEISMDKSLFNRKTKVITYNVRSPAKLSSRRPRPAPESSPSPASKNVKVSPDKSATDKATPAGSPTPAAEQIVTEIYADKAVFDSTKSIGVFTGHIIVIDPRFQIQ